MESYEDQTVQQLRQKLKNLKLSQAGTKKILIERLREHDNLQKERYPSPQRSSSPRAASPSRSERPALVSLPAGFLYKLSLYKEGKKFQVGFFSDYLSLHSGVVLFSSALLDITDGADKPEAVLLHLVTEGEYEFLDERYDIPRDEGDQWTLKLEQVTHREY